MAEVLFLLTAWLMAAAAYVLPAIALLKLLDAIRQKRRRTGGLCLTCGYDLHGNVSGTCPECGAPIE